MNPDQIPDWEWHNLPDEDMRILDALDDLRRDEPIVWAMVLGHRNSHRIAQSLGMPHETVLYELRRYKRREITIDEQLDSGIVWRLLDDHHLELRRWVAALRKKDRLDRD